METTEAVSETKVVVSRVTETPLKDVWAFIMRPEGQATLLGEGGVLGNKGEDWRATDGTYGITRSFHPLEQIRFSWHGSEGAPATLVDLQLHTEGDGTRLDLSHENLPSDADVTALETKWTNALDQIVAGS
ncbi:SRPBCC domain-containing protein [Arachnia propionica]|uniref:SRPBCC domain-containing protein n=1 Tax=Arachnia propionica TaxID=1750 RepID=A0A3P1T4L9_9ACTN|nr:SRPBCC domain-containing protein [Arachnia propionica]MDO5083617.1 SRPBCC domain-containing protein [Arachnia propionica]RRD04264.1 SRPBCC domain-containing protein [Arachnia propionica]